LERFVTDYTYAKKRKRDLGEVCDRLLGVNTPTQRREKGKREKVLNELKSLCRKQERGVVVQGACGRSISYICRR
jgi:hypothetical protein